MCQMIDSAMLPDACTDCANDRTGRCPAHPLTRREDNAAEIVMSDGDQTAVILGGITILILMVHSLMSCLSR